jgi:hypothetical protein
MTKKFPMTVTIQSEQQLAILTKVLHRILFPEDGPIDYSLMDMIDLHPFYERLTGDRRKIKSGIGLINAGDD